MASTAYTEIAEQRGDVSDGTEVIARPKKRDGTLADIKETDPNIFINGPSPDMNLYVLYIGQNKDKQREIIKRFLYTHENADEVLKEEKEWLNHYGNT
jgi:hypothetical protein